VAVIASINSSRERQGLLLCVLAAAGFGSMAVLAKLAYASGATVLTLVSVRFAIGAALLWGFAAWRGVLRIPDRRTALGALLLGLLLYSAESGLYSSALTRIDASLAELLMFSYPAIVVLAAIALRREPASSRRIGAVAIASSGVALVLLGGSTGAIDPVGVGLALTAALLYAGYVLSADALGGRLHPLVFSALICTGAAISFSVVGGASGQLRLGALHGEAWLWIAVIGVLCTAVAMSAFIAGVERLGPSRASIMSALDPLVAVTAGAMVFGERLGPVQMLGGLLVVAAVIVLQLPAAAAMRSRARARASAVTRGRVAPVRQVRARTAERRPACEPGARSVPSRDRGASARPAPQPSAGSLALVTSERR
jgi:drug/metabolite transporter (DMT)-like permease